MPANRAEAIAPLKVVGRYAIFSAIAKGGMATIHLGRMLGEVGFARTVAIKRLHEHLATDPELSAMLLDEARMAARIRHPNVVSTLDVISSEGEVFLVMEYVHGQSLSRLLAAARKTGERVAPSVLANVISGALQGLHAAHEATSELGEPLGLVHRDMSPENVLVGVDGVARVADFGVAKARGRTHATREGQLKGKLAYMAPEQVRGREVTRRTDVFAAGIVLWESLTSEFLFRGDNEADVLYRVLEAPIDPPSRLARGLPEGVDAVVLRALERDPEKRFATALEMSVALERAIAPVTQREVGAWVERSAAERLAQRAQLVSQIEPIASVEAARGSLPSIPAAEAPAEAVASDVSSVAVTRARRMPSSRARRSSFLAIAFVAATAGGTAAWLGLRSAASESPVPAGAPSAERPAPPAAPVEQARPVEETAAAPSAAAPLPVAPSSSSPPTSARPAPRPRTKTPPPATGDPIFSRK